MENFSLLPTDLQDLICLFTYDANLKQTRRSLNYILFIKDLEIHPACLREGTYDYSHCSMYDRESLLHYGFFSPWTCPRVDSPFRHFFVWFAIRDLYNIGKMCWIIDDLDFRSSKKLFENFPTKPSRLKKEWIKETIRSDPEISAIRLSPIFQNLEYRHLRLSTTSMGRFLCSDMCPKTPNWNGITFSLL